MSTSVTIEEALANLRDLVGRLAPGDELVLTDGDRPVAKLVAPPAEKPRRKIGTLRGTVLYMAPDFNAPLNDFKEYME